MPPILSRKRTRSPSPSPKPDPPSKRIRAPNPPPRRGKILDAPPTAKRTLSQTKAFLEGIDTDSALSDPESSDDDFEDVPLNSTSNAHAKAKAQTADDSEETGKMRSALTITIQNMTMAQRPRFQATLLLRCLPYPRAHLTPNQTPKKVPRKYNVRSATSPIVYMFSI
jgi:hypothetical protein